MRVRSRGRPSTQDGFAPSLPEWVDGDEGNGRDPVIWRFAIELEYWIRRGRRKVEYGVEIPLALKPFTLSFLIEFDHARVTRVIRVAGGRTVPEGT